MTFFITLIQYIERIVMVRVSYGFWVQGPKCTIGLRLLASFGFFGSFLERLPRFVC